MNSRIFNERARARTPRRGEQPPKDATLSVMLAQIVLCLILLALAWCLKLSGLPFYQTARGAMDSLLRQELDLGPVNEVMARWDLQVPAWLSGKPAEDAPSRPEREPYIPGEGEEQPAGDGDADAGAAQAQEPAEDPPLIDDELAGYIAQYLPDEGAAEVEPDPASAPLPEPGAADGERGQGGGINPVRLVGKSERLAAPGGCTLSPFFLSDKPILPVKYGVLTCAFGYRTHPITGKPDFHTGVDIGAPAGAPVSAVLPGVVKEVGQSSVYGNYIVLSHGAGLETAYCHCSEVLAPEGAVIRKREVIARVGSTGLSTGDHVHLEFRVGGLLADPSWVYDEF